MHWTPIRVTRRDPLVICRPSAFRAAKFLQPMKLFERLAAIGAIQFRVCHGRTYAATADFFGLVACWRSHASSSASFQKFKRPSFTGLGKSELSASLRTIHMADTLPYRARTCADVKKVALVTSDMARLDDAQEGVGWSSCLRLALRFRAICRHELWRVGLCCLTPRHHPGCFKCDFDFASGPDGRVALVTSHEWATFRANRRCHTDHQYEDNRPRSHMRPAAGPLAHPRKYSSALSLLTRAYRVEQRPKSAKKTN